LNSKAPLQTNVFPNRKQQHFYYGTHIPKPICIQEVEQYGSSSSYEERERELGKNVSQDIEGIGSDD